MLAAENLATSRDPKGFDSIDAFLTQQSLAGLEINTGQISINSEYFVVYIESRFADRTIKLQSLLHRNTSDGEIQLISRDRSSRYLWPKNKPDA